MSDACRTTANPNVTVTAEHVARHQPVKEIPVKYMLLIFSSEAAQQAASKADTEQMHAAYGAYAQALIKAGAMAGGERLHPTSSATTVRVSGGKTKVVNGPYAETKEQLGDLPGQRAVRQPATAPWKCAPSGRCNQRSDGARKR